MAGRLLLCAPVLACIAAGCAVDQDKETAIYRKIVDIAPVNRPATRPADRPLGLVEAMLLANQENERLSREGEDYLQAVINRKRAVALFLPTADLSASYGFGGSDFPNSDGGDFDVSAIGRLNLFNGFRDVARLRVADLTIDQRRLLLLDVQESLLADVVRAYHDVLRLEEEVKVLEASLELQEQRVRDARGRQQAGAARMLDVSQTEAQAAGTRVRLLNNRSAARNARAALALVTALPAADMPLLDEGLAETSPPDLEQAIAVALETRHDLQAAARAREAQRAAVQVAVGQHYPSLAVDLRYFLERQSSPTDLEWDSVIDANLPIFSAGQIRADVREAWSIYRQSLLFESLLRRQIRHDVEVAWRNYSTSLQRIGELNTQVAAAQQALTQAEASFDAGLATNLERLVAQDQYLNARLQLTSERYNQRVYASDLARALGTLRPLLEQMIAGAPPTTGPAAPLSAGN